jgi:hypothetical protein
MKSLSDAQIEQMVNDISSIKEVLAKSKPSIQLLFLPVHFRLIFLLTGASIVIFSGIYFMLVAVYGSYADIPELYRYILYAAMLVDGVALGVLKNRNWVTSLSKINPKYNFRQAYREFFSFKIIHTFIVMIITFAFFIVYWMATGRPYLIIPTLSIGIGILGNFIGNMTDIAEYTLFGSWTLIWGFVIIVAGTIPAPIALICSLGIGMLLFAGFNYIGALRRER